MPTDDIDRQVANHLAILIQKDEPCETVGEISTELALTMGQVRASLRRLTSFGEVVQIGEAASGAKTWTLTSDPRLEA